MRWGLGVGEVGVWRDMDGPGSRADTLSEEHRHPGQRSGSNALLASLRHVSHFTRRSHADEPDGHDDGVSDGGEEYDG